MIRYDSRV